MIFLITTSYFVITKKIFILVSGVGETHNFNTAPKWCIQKEGRMITQFENTKLWIDQELFEVSRMKGHSGTTYYIYQNIETGEFHRLKPRSIANHIEKVIVRNDLSRSYITRTNHIGQSINGKGIVVKAERQNQVGIKVKRSMVYNHDGNLVRNGG